MEGMGGAEEEGMEGEEGKGGGEERRGEKKGGVIIPKVKALNYLFISSSSVSPSLSAHQ